jgi:hypothetical protein
LCIRASFSVLASRNYGAVFTELCWHAARAKLSRLHFGAVFTERVFRLLRKSRH